MYRHPTDFNLPSWVPDWSRHRTTKRFVYGDCSGYSRAVPTLKDGNSLGLQGVLVGTLSYVAAPVEMCSTDAEILEICCSWMKLVSKEENVRVDTSTDVSFVETILAGDMSEMQPSEEKNHSNLDEVKTYLTVMGGTDDGRDSLSSDSIRNACEGRSFFKTAESTFGLGPQPARPGDRVAVILGCRFPLILRPHDVSEKICFRVVGPCYISGMMSGEAILGPFPAGWRAKIERSRNLNRRIVFTDGDTLTEQDPRMPLPTAWRYRYGDWATPQEVEAEKLEEMTEQWFENVKTGEKTWNDPRLTPELLKERGVAIEELILI